jgi:hypothetical protein
MDQSKLRDASESVEGETVERLRTQADALADHAEAERGPDHGEVARYQETLREIKETETGIADEIDRTYALCNEYRETVEGV